MSIRVLSPFKTQLNLPSRSISLPGNNVKYISVPVGTGLDFSSVLFSSVWYKGTDTTQNTGIFAHSQYVQNDRVYGMETWDAGAHFGVMVSSNGTVGKFWVGDDGINDGLWHHLLCICDTNATNFKLFVDNREQTLNKVTDGTFTTFNSEPSIPFTIGCLLDAGTPTLSNHGKIFQPMNGKLLVDAGQRAELFNGGAGVTLNPDGSPNISFASSVSSFYPFRSSDTLASIVDTSGRGNNGVYNSGSLADFTSDVPNPALQGLNFDTNKSITYPYASSVGFTTSATVFFFYRYTESGSEQVICCHADFALNKRSWFVEKYFSDPTRLAVFLSDSGTTSQKVYYTPAGQNDRKWHSFAFTWGSSTLKIYKDAVDITALCTKATDIAMTTLFNSNTTSLTVGAGRTNGSPTLFYNGYMDLFYTNSAELSASQIMDLHVSGLGQINFSTLDSWSTRGVWYLLTNSPDSTTTFVDQTGNGNTGTGANLVSGDFIRGVW